MNQKSSYAFRLVLGGWLTYLGVSLLYQMYKERPSNMVLISVIAVVFVIVDSQPFENSGHPHAQTVQKL